MFTENIISKTKNVLLVLTESTNNPPALQHLVQTFCGQVVQDLATIEGDLSQKRLYVCGDIGKLAYYDAPFFVIRELSYYDETPSSRQVISLGQVPIVVGEAGVYFRCLFDDATDYFHNIKTSHTFQDLTESTKPSQAFRKGIYLTEVTQELTSEQGEVLHYRLLRCSSNFSGPTENFRHTDHQVIKAVNEAASYVFEKPTTLNHVLAQIYENKKADETEGKEKKAKIKAHSDKTKDMPPEGLIAFCTFYDKAGFQHLKPSPTDQYDWQHKDISGLTRLHFKLKPTVQDHTLTKEFTVTLYPNSVFLIPLSTNRLYTHEIKPSILPIDKIPTRMGYVVRCSNKEAVYMNEQAYLKEDGALIQLAPMTYEGMANLKETYRQENQSENQVQYGKIDFSMNLGDYQKPIY